MDVVLGHLGAMFFPFDIANHQGRYKCILHLVLIPFLPLFLHMLHMCCHEAMVKRRMNRLTTAEAHSKIGLPINLEFKKACALHKHTSTCAAKPLVHADCGRSSLHGSRQPSVSTFGLQPGMLSNLPCQINGRLTFLDVC